MLKNAPPGWKIEAAKQIYSNDFIKLFEDTLDLNGEEKIYTSNTQKLFDHSSFYFR